MTVFNASILYFRTLLHISFISPVFVVLMWVKPVARHYFTERTWPGIPNVLWVLLCILKFFSIILSFSCINDLSDIFDTFLLFADDLKENCCISTLFKCEILQEEKNEQDSLKNGMFLNIEKCFVITFARKLNTFVNSCSINSN